MPKPHDYLLFYETILRRPAVLTIIREPLAHALSWLCFYRRPQKMEELVREMETMPENLMAKDLGLYSDSDVQRFLETDSWRFALICLTEMFDECLLMLKRKFGLSFREIMYLRQLDSAQLQRNDAWLGITPPSPGSLPTEALRLLEQRTSLDFALYETCRHRFEQLVHEGGPNFQAELGEYKILLRQHHAASMREVSGPD
eukprot:m.181032 g.181032  ORF g.181032 m.181032 type:complete len:201 (+) comp53453_c0_seq1:800-1402(+)